MSNKNKTNVMRLLEQQDLPYNEYELENDIPQNGVEVAKEMGNNPDQQFKTLLTEGKSDEHYVFMVPVNEELDLKKGAKAVGEKNINMIKEKELFPLTGYVHGGCSPIGMKKDFKTTIHDSANDFPTIIYSAGKPGQSVETKLTDLETMIDLQVKDIIKE